jgi:glutathione peroxidase
MKTLLITLLIAFMAALPTKSVLDFKVKDIDGKDVSLGQYKGKVLLIINVASQCGNTPQYTDIEALYEKYKDKGLVILGFPANNFMGQEPGTNSEIKEFCTSKYAVTFPMFSKISVKGDDIAPLYSYLTQKSENGVIDAPIKWNFQKFLVGKDGKVITSFTPKTKVSDPDVMSAIDKALAQTN